MAELLRNTTRERKQSKLAGKINVDGRGPWRSTQWDLNLASKGRTIVLAIDEVEIERTVFRASEVCVER